MYMEWKAKFYVRMHIRNRTEKRDFFLCFASPLSFFFISHKCSEWLINLPSFHSICILFSWFAFILVTFVFIGLFRWMVLGFACVHCYVNFVLFPLLIYLLFKRKVKRPRYRNNGDSENTFSFLSSQRHF